MDGPVRVPWIVGVGTANVTTAFDAWRDGHVAPTSANIPIIAPLADLKLEPVSGRLKQELIHPNRTSLLVGLQFSPDGKRIIAGDYPGGVIVVWDAATGKQVSKTIDTGYRGSQAPYFFVSPDWQRVYVPLPKSRTERVEQEGQSLTRWAFDGAVRTWDLASGRSGTTYKHQPARNILSVELSPDGTEFVSWDQLPGIYASSPKSVWSLWNVRTGECRPLSEKSGFAKFSPDARLLAITERGDDDYARAVKLIDRTTGQERSCIAVQEKNASVSVGAFSPDGRLLVGNCRVHEGANKRSYKCWLKWWETTTGREVASLNLDTFGSGAYFTPDSRTLAVLDQKRNSGKLLLFDVPSKRLTREAVVEGKANLLSVHGPAISADSKWLALTTQELEKPAPFPWMPLNMVQPRIHLINIATGEICETLVCPQGLAWSACFSPDGRTLATGGYGRVLVWDITNLPGTASGRRNQ